MIKTIFFFLSLSVFLGACSSQTAVEGKLDQGDVRTALLATGWPAKITTDTDFKISMKVLNTGAITIPSLGKDGDMLRVGASYHWLGTDNRVVLWDGFFSPLKSDLKPGKSQDLLLAVRSPKAAGKYILEVDMLQNSVFWFGGAGSQTARMVIDVVD